MKPRKISITKQIALGWFIGFLVAQPLFAQVPGLPQPVVVIGDTSPTTIAQMQQQTQQTVLQTSVAADAKKSRIQTALENIKQAERWADTVNKYSETKIREVRRFSSLKGIMGFAEKQIGLSTDSLKAMGDVGELIRGVYTLKKQYQSLVRTRLAMIMGLREERNRKRRCAYNKYYTLSFHLARRIIPLLDGFIYQKTQRIILFCFYVTNFQRLFRLS
jgi:hypothetical protein